jgi:hypothetical protein
MRKRSVLVLLTLVFTFSSLFYFEPSKAQNKAAGQAPPPAGAGKVKQVAALVRDSKAAGAGFGRRVVFRTAARVADDPAQLGAVLGDGAVFDLDRPAAARVLQEKATSMTLPVPDGKGGSVELELVRAEIFAPGFAVKTSRPTGERLEESFGVHYRGVVKGDERSLAAVSFFKNEVMGFYSTEAGGNSVLGRLGGNNPDGKHILYAERDVKSGPDLFCNTDDTGDPPMTLPEPAFADGAETAEQALAKCVRIYVEVGHDIFLNKGSAANATSYITAMFNQSAALFANDGIPVSLSEIFVWTTADPYNGGSSLDQLQTFKATRTTFNGNLAHLVTLESQFGGVAYVPGLCNTGFTYAFSGINPTFNNLPTFSWTVEVFTHETGHNLGSRHTHACAWNGNNTAIDGCAAPEGACAQPATLPTNGGTVMSYCHLTSAGINFANGFGAQPRDVILNRINTGTCVTDCGGSGGCTYSVSPASRSFTATGGAGSLTLTAGAACPWTATVNAPATAAVFSFIEQENLFELAAAPDVRADGPVGVDAPTVPDVQVDAPVGGLPVFSNATPISINDRGVTVGLATPYPSTINVSGLSGNVTKVTATLNGFGHSFPADVDVMLVGPGGQRAVLMSDAGGGSGVSGVNLTFDQNAASDVPVSGPLFSGAYRPANYVSESNGDDFPSPGPGVAVFGSDLSVFNGTSPNGTWRLYVVDDAGVDVGSITNGWSLNVTAGTSASWINLTSAASGTGGATITYSVSPNTGASARTGTITVSGKTHTVTQAGTQTTVAVTVRTNPVGRAFTVDGVGYTASQTFNWTPGSSHTIATTSPQNGAAGTRYVWANWSDGGAISHTVAPTAATTYTANFTTQHRLTTAVSPAGSGAVSPASGTWYNAGQSVPISATPASGFGFNGWTGSGTGSFTGATNPASVTMSGPVTETANFVNGPPPPTGRRNVAAAVNGATATASSTLNAGLAAAAAINGDRKGIHWGSDPLTGSGWHDAGLNSYPDALQINFNGAKSINEVVVYSVQDAVLAPSEPTDAMTFTRYGLVNFEVQYWTGAAWVTAPNGLVARNNRVKRTIMFRPLTTSQIRVLVTGGGGGHSRVVEVEAFEVGTNVALSSAGAVATASSTLDAGRGPAGAVNGDWKGLNWGRGGGWHDATANAYPDWLQVDFSGPKTIGEIDVYTIQDNFATPTDPTDTLTFLRYGIVAYDVQYWNGAAWVTVPGGSVASNNRVWRRFVFTPVTTSRIRVLVRGALGGHSRVIEVEAYQ